MRTLLLASALLAVLLGSSAAGPVAGPTPYHAFCRILWLFQNPCAEINAKLVKQIQTFNPRVGCDECNYRLVSVNPRYIRANHTSPDGPDAEGITFTMRPTAGNGCHVSARSASFGFKSRLDDGKNYCNLYNLLSASGLDSEPGFTQMTNEWACLGYGLATCNAKQAFMSQFF